MSSGLREAYCAAGGTTYTLTQTLNEGFMVGSGSFSYMCTNKLFAWIIHTVTGQTPKQYADGSLFPSLGIAPSDYSWPTDGGTVMNTEKDLHMNARALAKLMLFYRQSGVPAPGSPALVSTTFVQSAMTSHWTAWASSAYCGGSPRLIGCALPETDGPREHARCNGTTTRPVACSCVVSRADRRLPLLDLRA
jgi:hypothetical protein